MINVQTPIEKTVSYVTLNDGSVVQIRPINAADADCEREFIENLSPETRYHRFLEGSLHPTPSLIKKLVDIDHDRDEAYAAFTVNNNRPIMLGVARYFAGVDNKICECAVAVTDAWQHKGLATLLMKRLIDTARERGVKLIYSIDAAENASMRDFAKYLGFDRNQNADDHTLVTHTLCL